MSLQHDTETRTAARGAPHPVDVHVGARIRARREALGLTHETLAGLIGVTFQQLQKYENGSNRCAPARLAALATALDAPIGFFFPADLSTAAAPEPFHPQQAAILKALAATRKALDAAEALLSTKH